MANDWYGPFKRIIRAIIFEDLAIYTAGLVASLSADCIYILPCFASSSSDAHPFRVGIGQLGVAVIFAALIIRKIAQLRYWTNDYSESRQDS